MTKIPVMVARGWSEAQQSAFVLPDNNLALNASWVDALLKIELTELQALDFDLGVTGFSLDEIATLTMDAAAGQIDPPPTMRRNRCSSVVFWLSMATASSSSSSTNM